MSRDVAASPVSTGPTPVLQLQQQVAPASKSPASTPARIRKDKVYFGYTLSGPTCLPILKSINVCITNHLNTADVT